MTLLRAIVARTGRSGRSPTPLLIALCAAPLFAQQPAAPTPPIPAASPSTTTQTGPAVPPGDEAIRLLGLLRELRAAHAAEQQRRHEALLAARQTGRALEAELAELQRRHAELLAEQQVTSVEVTELQRDAAARAPLDVAAAQQLDTAIGHAREFVARGPDLDRPQRLRALPPLTGDASGTTFEQPLAAWCEFVRQELRLARSNATSTGQVPLDATREKLARRFRIGHLVHGFVTEDGRETGLETAAGWRALPADPVDAAVRAAVAILDQGRAPRLVVLPLRTQ